MIGLDTNVLVRYLTHDDPTQTAAAMRVMNSLSFDAPGFLSLIVIAELVWVLAISYRFPKDKIAQVVETLLRSRELVVERGEIVSQALRAFNAGRADFSDYLIERCAHAAQCQFTLTFDQKAASAAGMRLLQ
ncbi:MAG TPA: type II toxin-antitoxin system VapC family toxin [Candidatus Aquilonibacter sp.]|jgi:predicted nucleic-acid-binding protein|nr:type II toxin-antitoxin system VapC family toxin [Candidatus Aquilonibacter sp.]